MSERFPGVRRLFRIRGVARDLDEELKFHFERTAEELVALGWSAPQAVLEARRRFGDIAHWRSEMETISRRGQARRRRADALATTLEHVRHALRGLGRAPGFAAAVILTFALGIGANATMFGIVDRLLLRPPTHVADPDAVRHVLLDRYYDFRDARDTTPTFNYPSYRDLEQARTLAGVAAYTGRREMTVGRGAAVEQFQSRWVSGDFFELLGVQPAHGRFFGAEEDRIGGEAVAVVSHELWHERYGGSPDVLGETLDFGDGPYAIIGVAPAGFTGVRLEAVDVWLPLEQTAALVQGTRWYESRDWWWLNVVARLAEGATAEQFAAEATGLHLAGMQGQIDAGYYRDDSRIVASPLIAANGPLATGEFAVARWLAGVSLLVLLIACANVANLLLARSFRQRREIAVRMALGVTRARLMAQLLTETLVLVLLGGAAALAVTRWGGDFVRGVLLPDIAWHDAAGWRVVAFILIACVVSVIFAGLIPALQASRPQVAAAIRSGGRGVVGSGARIRNTLTIAQAALSVLLLVGAGLFVRSLHRVNSIDLGFDPANLYTLQPIWDGEIPRDEELRFFMTAAERIARVPGVEGATTSVGTPFWSDYGFELSVPGIDSLPQMPGGGPYYVAADPSYFRTMRLRILRGRGIEERDREGAPLVTVVNQTMARTLWPGEDAIGRCLIINSKPCAQIVGIVEDATTGTLIDAGRAMQYYVPLAQRFTTTRPETVLLRLAGGGTAALRTAQAEAMAVDSRLRFAQVRSFEELIDPQRRSWMLGATMFSLFGLLAVLVASLGLYSLLAFEVAQRTQEISVRSALGATRTRLVALVMSRGVRLAGIGVLLGTAAALLLAPRMEEMLYGVGPRDPRTIGAVVLLLMAIAALASGLPAWRAARVDPNVALRAD